MTLREATEEDLPDIIKMLADDKLGRTRERYRDPLPKEYYEAFGNIKKDPNQELIVVEDEKSGIIGTLQLSFIQYLTYTGGTRAQIEAVRVRKDVRGKGIGQLMFEWAIRTAKDRNAHLLQLTVDRKRPEAITFYERLGFQSTHEGMKIHFK